jgi:hypothetical protein
MPMEGPQMTVANDGLQQLLICIGSKCDIPTLILEDPRFGVRLLQTVRGCLGCTTDEAKAFMESTFGKQIIPAIEGSGTSKQAVGHPDIAKMTKTTLSQSRFLKDDH